MSTGLHHIGNHQACPPWVVHHQAYAISEENLFQAVAIGDGIFVERMIHYGINVNARTITGNTAAILAAEYSQIDVLFLLMEHARADLSIANNCGFTVMHALAEHGHFDVMEAVGALYGAPANEQCWDGVTPLHLAARNGHVEACRVLVEKLHVDVNTMDNEGRTALYFAAWSRNEKIVRILLKAMASNPQMQAKSAGHVLPIAAAFGLTTLVKDLVDKYNADINSRDQRHKNSALMLAANHGHLEIVKFLDQKHADLNLRNTSGSTAVMLAACEGHFNVLKYFIKRSATVCIDFKAVNAWNFSAMDYARIRPADDLVHILTGVMYGKTSQRGHWTRNKKKSNSIKAYHGKAHHHVHHSYNAVLQK